MTGMGMMIEVLGDVPVSRMLGRVKHDVEDWEDAWPEVAKHLATGAKKQFSSHGVYGSDGWDPISDEWKAWKQKHGFMTDILRMTGRLEESLTVEDHPERLQIMTPEAMWWGTLVPYAKYHQHGIGQKVRKVIEPPEGSRRYMVRILQGYALRNVDRMIGASGSL